MSWLQRLPRHCKSRYATTTTIATTIRPTKAELGFFFSFLLVMYAYIAAPYTPRTAMSAAMIQLFNTTFTNATTAVMTTAFITKIAISLFFVTFAIILVILIIFYLIS